MALQNGTTLDSQSFSWDRGQNKRVMSDSAPGLTALTRTNTYDSLSRLTATAGTAYGAGAQVALDAANNRVLVTGGLHPDTYLMSASGTPTLGCGLAQALTGRLAHALHTGCTRGAVGGVPQAVSGGHA